MDQPRASDPADNRETVLVIDDSLLNLRLIEHMLKADYHIKTASDGWTGIQLAATVPKPDLILLDVTMPGIDGYEVCRQLKGAAATAAIPVVFLTAHDDVQQERRGLELGAVDYIKKPISQPIILARVRNHLQLKQAADLLKGQNSNLEAEVRRRTQEILDTQDALLIAMASLAETRDNETANHIRRTKEYVRLLARDQQRQGNSAIDDAMLETLYKAAPLHDIGKVGIPDRILLKVGRFLPEEFELMQQHTILGHDVLHSVERELQGKSFSFLHVAREMALTHHERWDGHGYPHGLRGAEIPLSGRLMAIADVYDALVSRRSYKPPLTHEVAHELIVADRGTHFDPALVDSFILVSEEFRQVAEGLRDALSIPDRESPLPVDPHLRQTSGLARAMAVLQGVPFDTATSLI